MTCFNVDMHKVILKKFFVMMCMFYIYTTLQFVLKYKIPTDFFGFVHCVALKKPHLCYQLVDEFMFPNLVIIQTPHRLRHKFIPSTSLRMDWMFLSLWIFSIMLSSVQTQEDKKDEAWSYVNFLRNEVRYYIKLMDIMNVGR